MHKYIAVPRPVQGRELSIIEYIGLPGAGKTTAAKAFISQSECAVDPLSIRVINLERERRISRVAFKLKHILSRPLDSVNVARATRRCRRDIADGCALRFTGAVFNMMFIVALLRSATSSRTLVLDQGFYQGCWALLCSLQKCRRAAVPIAQLFDIAFPKGLSLKVSVLHVSCTEHELLKRRHARELMSKSQHRNDNVDLPDEIDCIEIMLNIAEEHFGCMGGVMMPSPGRFKIKLYNDKKGCQS